jgi:hypothetical protein
MAELPPDYDSNADTGGIAATRPDGGSSGSTPRWVKILGIHALIVGLLFLILHLTLNGPGGHGPSGRLKPLDAEAIGQAAGTKAMTSEDGAVRIGWARDDIKVMVDKMPMKSFAGLASVAAFQSAQHGAIVMGDMVVFQDEVTPAMDAAFKHGLEVTGLHNHFFFDEPKVWFMHIGGSGDAEKLAAGVKAAWDASKEVRKQNPQPADSFPGSVADANGSLNVKQIEEVLGHKSQAQDGVVKISIRREGQMHGVKIGRSMGLSTAVAFSGSDDYAAVYGDFIMTGGEVQPVLKALREHGIHIVALHNHMVGEEPAFYFTHFWGKGPAKELAQGIKAALEVQRRATTS